MIVNLEPYLDCKPKPMRTQEEIHVDILALEEETEGLLGEIMGGIR